MSVNHNVTIGQNIIRYLATSDDIFPSGASRLNNVTDLSYSVAKFGGYDTATIKMDVPSVAMMSAFDMLGSEIRIYDIMGSEVWEGFVNAVTTADDLASITYGPLMDMANRINLKFTVYQSGTNPPQGGEQAETGFLNANSVDGYASRNEWGEFSEIVSSPIPLQNADGIDEAYDVCTNLANLRCKPAQTVTMPSEGGAASIQLECLGYFHLWKKRIADYFVWERWNAALVMGWPFESQAPSFFNTTNIEFETGGPMLHLWNDEMETVYDFLESQFSVLATSGDYGYIFGVYNDRSVFMKKIVQPSRPDVFISLRSMSPNIGRGASPIMMPGMWAKPVDVPFYIPAVAEEMFLINSIELSGGVLSVNRETFSAIDKALSMRGL